MEIGFENIEEKRRNIKSLGVSFNKLKYFEDNFLFKKIGSSY